jgi:hypothetical protein
LSRQDGGATFNLGQHPKSARRERKTASKQKMILKVKERPGNIYENKGPGFHSPTKTGNLIENKDT